MERVEHFVVLILGSKPESQADARGEWISGRSVDAFAQIARLASSRFEKVLRLEISFIEKVVDRKIEIDPASELFGYGEIDNVVARRPQCAIFGVEPIV